MAESRKPRARAKRKQVKAYGPKRGKVKRAARQGKGYVIVAGKEHKRLPSKRNGVVMIRAHQSSGFDLRVDGPSDLPIPVLSEEHIVVKSLADNVTKELRKSPRGVAIKISEIETDPLPTKSVVVAADVDDQESPDESVVTIIREGHWTHLTETERAVEAQKEFLRQFRVFRYGSSFPDTDEGATPYVMPLHDWEARKQVFGVTYQGIRAFPAFQFTADGDPLPVIERVLKVLPTDMMTEWEVAFWWNAGNEWLEGERPVDFMEIDPEQTVLAAEMMAKPLVT